MSARPLQRSIWAMPVLLGVVSALGLAAALLFDAWGNWLSWVALTAVSAVSLWICVRAMGPRRPSRERVGQSRRDKRGDSSLR